MDYEKAYKEALESAREIIKDYEKRGLKEQLFYAKEDLEGIFPELRESEDEKVRKALIEYFNEQCDMSDWNGVYGYQVVAWLEKQKSVGEIVERCKNSWYNEGKIAGMAEGLTNDEKYQQGWHDALEKQGKKKAIMNVPSREVILSIWDLGNEWKELTNGSISTEYGTQLDYIQKHWHESEYYLREKQGEQNSTLSDEDKMMLNELIIGFYGYRDQYPNFWKLRTDEIIEWLKKKKDEHTTDNGRLPTGPQELRELHTQGRCMSEERKEASERLCNEPRD